MRNLVVALSLIVIGCGSPAKPGTTAPAAAKSTAPAKPATPAAPVKPPVVAKAEPVRPSCDAAAKRLIAERRLDKIADKDRERARRAGEAVVAAECLDAQWPDAALECMTSRASAESCVGQLTKEQESLFTMRIEGWQRNWTKGEAGGDDSGSVAHEKKPPKEEFVWCDIKAIAELEPIIKPTAHAHDYVIGVRKRAIDSVCERRLSNDSKKCFNAATDAAAIATCRGQLDVATKNAFDNALGEAADEIKKLEALEKNAKAIDCKAVAAIHYSDDAAKGKLMVLPAADRKRMLVESRAKMAKTCADDKWSTMSRACIVAQKNQDAYEIVQCFGDSKHGFGMGRWGFPAPGVTFKTGVAECDQLSDLITKLASCDKLEKELRESLRESIGAQLAMYIDGYTAARDGAGKSCRDAAQMYTEGARSRGCTL